MTALRPRARRARQLRREATDAERKLWRALGESGWPVKFRRQHPIGQRIADFACPSRKLVVEIDGGQHNESAADETRTAALERRGYRVIRFWNNDVLTNIEGVIDAIRRELGLGPG